MPSMSTFKSDTGSFGVGRGDAGDEHPVHSIAEVTAINIYSIKLFIAESGV